jgi:quercetin dioxygenase-like cupin family protein
MTNKVKKEVQYYPKRSLILKPDFKGAKMWSVALEKTMFTYFSIEPESSFDTHSHDSEQITMVLEGELFFEVAERIICVKKGEVIAIPSNIPHAAFTKDSTVIAVDAWSPIPEKYKDRQK